jgi:ATP-dependent RNA helicase DDX24/MAK5
MQDLYLYAALMLNTCRRTLVFTNSITAVRRVTPMLTNLNLKAHPLHSQMPQKARLRSIERFTGQKGSDTKPEPTILVATDVAARGLDIPNVDMVVHYHVPRAADAYVHRSGRTARGTNEGTSILLCAPEEVVPTRRLVAKVHADEKASQKKYTMRTVDVDRKLVTRLKPRVTLAKKIADAYLAKEKATKEEDWAKNAAEELGVEYDEEELEWSGRGSLRKKKEKEAKMLTKNELGALKAQLRDMLAKRVNAGVSERYITGGSVDVDALLKNEGLTSNGFLGRVDGLMGDV